MDEDSFIETWVNYGLIVRLPFKDISILKEFCKEKGIRVIFDKASLSHIIIKEVSPSGNLKDDSQA
jgi:hypothetical protein